MASFASLVLACLALTLSVVNAATFQQVSISPSLGVMTARSRGQFSAVQWNPLFTHVLSYGATDTDAKVALELVRIANGTLYRRLANTTFQLEQYGFAVLQKGGLQSPNSTILSPRTRGHAATVFVNTSGLINSTAGRNDQPRLNMYGGDSNGIISDITWQFRWAWTLNDTGGYYYDNIPQPLTIFTSGNSASYAREGLTVATTRANVNPDVFGRLYYFGGKQGSTYFNNLFYQEQTLAGTTNFITVTGTQGTAPSARAYHGMALIDGDVLAGRYLFIWGGESAAGVQVGDGPFLYDIPSNQWIVHVPTGAAPSAREGHALVNLGDRDMVYLFGGMSGPTNSYTFYNDLWSYRISSQTWTRLQTGQDSPVIGGAEILPAARAFMGVTAFDPTTFLMFGGENAFGGFNDMWSVNVNVTCPYYCVHPVDEGFRGACMDYQQCHFIKDCSWDPSQAFQCFLKCNSNPSLCNADLSAFSCPNGLTKCWSGFCQERIENCKPFPACPAGQRRCGDNGDCVPETTSCTPVVCNPGLKLCADGTCQTSCFPSYGCLPDDKPIQCGDGSCQANFAACNTKCNATYPVRCWYDCKADASQCEQPYWTDDIHLLAFTSPQQTYYRLYRKDGTIQDPEDLRGIIHLDKVRPGFNMTIYMKSAFGSELREVGPHPTWPTEFDSTYFRSLFVKTNVTNVLEAYKQGSGGINIIFRMKLNEIEKQYWSWHPGHGLGYIAATNCVAYAVDWFWDDMDLDPNSKLANVSYIKAYREKTLALSKNQTYSGPEPNPPKLRWQCQLLDPENAWPRFTNVSDDVLNPNADRYVGIRITGDFFERVMGVIYAPFPLPTPPAPKTVPKLPPPNKEATYVVLALASALLLVLIIIVAFKTFGQRN